MIFRMFSRIFPSISRNSLHLLSKRFHSEFATVVHSSQPLVKSHVHGACATPLLRETIGEALEKTTSQFGEFEALVVPYQDLRYTYADLLELSYRLAHGLLQMGLKKGDRVGIWSTNNAEWIITQYATALIGLVLVNVNPAYRPNELKYALNKVQMKCLILEEKFRNQDNIEAVRSIAPELSWFRQAPLNGLELSELPHLKYIVTLGSKKRPGMFKFSDILQEGAMAGYSGIQEVRDAMKALSVDDPINIQFTSGTTGNPKGAALTHFNILNNGFFVGEMQRFKPGVDKVCIPVPLYHCFGMVMGSLACITHGSTIVFPSPSFSAAETIKTLVTEQCTALYGVPTMFISILEHPDLRNVFLPAKKEYEQKTGAKWPLRTGIMSGSPCPLEIMKRVFSPEELGADEISVCYGMTETAPVSLMTSVSDPIEKRVGSVGRVMPHLESRIVDTANGLVAPVGVTGELQTRGYSVMLGYWDGDDIDILVTRGKKGNENIDSARWMHTGDLGFMDENGYVSVVGRSKDMIIRGGENIYPREIEELLYKCPLVEDAHVIGVPDAKYGEQVASWIKLRAENAKNLSNQELEVAIKDFCRESLSHFKVPKYLKFVDSFPMTISGKVQKFVMRDSMAKELNALNILDTSLGASTSTTDALKPPVSSASSN